MNPEEPYRPYETFLVLYQGGQLSIRTYRSDTEEVYYNPTPSADTVYESFVRWLEERSSDG